jgi:hypothetical protein
MVGAGVIVGWGVLVGTGVGVGGGFKVGVGVGDGGSTLTIRLAVSNFPLY